MGSRGPKRLAIKRCSKCERYLPRAAFYARANGQVVGPCRDCARLIAAAQRPTQKHVKAAFRERHRERLNAEGRAYRSLPATKQRRNAALRARKKSDPAFALIASLRRTLADKVRRAIAKKAASTLAILGCSIEEFMRHIERQWVPGMSWKNWGRGRECWHLDHKKPISAFDLLNPEHQRQCFHLSNFQPLWARDNLRKHAKYTEGMCGV